MNTDLITYQEAQSLAEVFAKSGYFSDARDMDQALVKIIAGRELGIGPVASMSGVYIVKGKPSLSANLLAGVLKKSGRYDYRVVTLTETECEIAFFQRMADKWQEIGRSVFTVADAKKAGTQNLDKFPRNMLFARTMTNGCRWYCPDVFAGGIYTPEELGAETDGETGEIINITPTVAEIVSKHTPTAPKTQAEAIGPDFDKPPAPDAPTAKMWNRYYTLTAEAKLAGLEVEELPTEVKAADMITAAKALKESISQAALQNGAQEIGA